MILSTHAVVGLVALLVIGVAAIAAAVRPPRIERVELPEAWKTYRFGFATVALVFLAFDMEMIFMYPWAVVFAEIGFMAFADMFVFIALLGSGISYAWAMGGLRWE